MTIKLGVIGAGQLGMYLCQAARRLGISTTLLAEQADMPAVSFADDVLIGALEDPAVINNLLESCDVLTFEKEDIPNETLSRIAQAQQAGDIAAHPSAAALFRIKDKGLQKQWLESQGFPNLPYRLLSGVDTDAQALAAEFGLPLVQKARCGGYDGLGVQIIESQEQLARLWPVPSVIEAFVPDCREVAVLLARSQEGDIRAYPPLGMAFDDGFNALSTVVTPADIPAQLATDAVTLATDIIASLGEAGVFAVELFIDTQDRIFVNEISPRVHNSGHLTMEASSASQFDQHVRAVAGMPLADIEMIGPAAMVNILYADALEHSCPSIPLHSTSEDVPVTVHWYGKPPGRQGRKMGHITALGSAPQDAAELARTRLGKLPEEKAEQAA